jgi:hypothetical protein
MATKFATSDFPLSAMEPSAWTCEQAGGHTQCCHSWPYAAAVAVFRLLRPKVCGHLTATFFFPKCKDFSILSA